MKRYIAQNFVTVYSPEMVYCIKITSGNILCINKKWKNSKHWLKTMDEIEKIEKRIEHWLSHSKGHMEELEKWQETLLKEGKINCSAKINTAMELLQAADENMQEALDDLRG